MPEDANEGVRKLDDAFKMVKKAEDIERKIKKAVKAKKLPKKRVRFLIDEAVTQNIITQEEANSLQTAVAMRMDAIQVDDFSQEEYISRDGSPGSKSLGHDSDGAKASKKGNGSQSGSGSEPMSAKS